MTIVDASSAHSVMLVIENRIPRVPCCMKYRVVPISSHQWVNSRFGVDILWPTRRWLSDCLRSWLTDWRHKKCPLAADTKCILKLAPDSINDVMSRLRDWHQSCDVISFLKLDRCMSHKCKLVEPHLEMFWIVGRWHHYSDGVSDIAKPLSLICTESDLSLLITSKVNKWLSIE